MRTIALVLLCVSCHREERTPKAIEIVPTAAASASSVTPTMDPTSVAKRWSESLNTSDMTTLASLYADNVKYYGVSSIARRS